MRLLLTRERDPSLSLKSKLEAQDFEVVSFPLIKIERASDGEALLQEKLKGLARYHWLILTSPNAVKALARYSLVWPKDLRIVAVGPQTAAYAQSLGWTILQAGKSRGSKGLIPLFEKEDMKGRRILCPQSNIGLKDWIKKLRALGAFVEVVEAYKTVRTKVKSEELKEILRRGIDAVLFFSPSAVEHFFDLVLPGCRELNSIGLIPFGETTASSLKTRGLKPLFLPKEATEEELIISIKKWRDRLFTNEAKSHYT